MISQAAIVLIVMGHGVHALFFFPVSPSSRKTRSDDDLNTAAFYQLVNKVDSLQAQLQATQTRVTDLQSKLQDENRHVVAFSAEMSTEDAIHASAGSIIPFDKVIVNTGTGYDPATSFFTAPFDGAYMFFVYADISTDYRALHYYKSGKRVAACDNDGGMRRITCGLTLSLTTADTVSLRHYLSEGSIGAGEASAFSGFRIH
ncbi:hypothetical protein V1264_021420 [Littorina saxatilis]